MISAWGTLYLVELENKSRIRFKKIQEKQTFSTVAIVHLLCPFKGALIT